MSGSTTKYQLWKSLMTCWSLSAFSVYVRVGRKVPTSSIGQPHSEHCCTRGRHKVFEHTKVAYPQKILKTWWGHKVVCAIAICLPLVLYIWGLGGRCLHVRLASFPSQPCCIYGSRDMPAAAIGQFSLLALSHLSTHCWRGRIEAGHFVYIVKTGWVKRRNRVW